MSNPHAWKVGDIVVVAKRESGREWCGLVVRESPKGPFLVWIATTRARTWISASRRLARGEEIARRASEGEAADLRAALEAGEVRRREVVRAMGERRRSRGVHESTSRETRATAGGAA